jgi:hypothetical protein
VTKITKPISDDKLLMIRMAHAINTMISALLDVEAGIQTGFGSTLGETRERLNRAIAMGRRCLDAYRERNWS